MIIYCDMDMVLCNFLKGALDVTGEPFPDKTGKLSKDEKKALIHQKKDFWDTLEWMPDAFLDSKRQNIQCSQHSALFDIQSGFCHRGPCEGDSLTKVASKVVNGALWLAPD